MYDLPAPTNCWTSVEDKIAITISQLQSFADFVGESPDDKVFLYEPTRSLSGRRFSAAELLTLGAWCVVDSANEAPYEIYRARSNRYEPKGFIVVRFEYVVQAADYADAEAEAATQRTFRNFIGTLIADIFTAAIETVGVHVRRIGVLEVYNNHPEKRAQQGYILGAAFQIDWGME